MKGWDGPLERMDAFRRRIPQSYHKGMRTDGLIFASEAMVAQIRQDSAAEQVSNVAHLPGIVGASMAMPDIHWGFGFPIGGVAAMDAEEGVVSPGGVGYDINCGVRLVRTDLDAKEVQPRVRELIDEIFKNVPSGLGSHGKIRIGAGDVDKVLEGGARWAVEEGYGTEEDLDRQEENGAMAGADPSKVSRKAKDRGQGQVGSLGAGNHFLEVQRVEEIYHPEAAKAMGIGRVGQVAVMIHTGSRGTGHQIATDYIAEMERAVGKYKLDLPDRQLACAPVPSAEAQDYFAAMACGANYAWANRQLIMHWVRESFQRVLGQDWERIGMHLVYDVAHNIAKKEEHEFEGRRRKVVVHRKGATRAFGPGRIEVPAIYRDYGQPVLIPGDMGTSSYVLVGTDQAMRETFGSTCHGAGRVMSRSEAIRRFTPRGVTDELAGKGIYVRAASKDVLTEEAPQAYKRVDDVVAVADGAGISRIVAKLVPMGVMKG